MENGYAKMSWSVGDVLELKEDWTEKQAITFLNNNGNRIRDRLIELGWEIIEDLIEFEEKENKP